MELFGYELLLTFHFTVLGNMPDYLPNENNFLSCTFSNNPAVRRQNGEYVVNGHRIVSWSGWYNVGGLKVKYKRFKDNIRETIEIFGPTNEDIYVTVSCPSVIIDAHLILSFDHLLHEGTP